jgi:hypothetical protein
LHSRRGDFSVASEPIVIFAIETSRAWPVAIYNDGGFQSPPCTLHDPRAMEFVKKYLTKDQKLAVVLGGKVIGSVTIQSTAVPDDMSCAGMSAEIDTPSKVADAYIARKEQLIALSRPPPDKQGAAAKRASDALAEYARDLAVKIIRANGTSEAMISAADFEPWLIDLNGHGNEEVVIFANSSVDEDLAALFVVAEKREDGGYQVVSSEYERGDEAHRCSMHFLDTLNLFPMIYHPSIFVQYHCYEGVAYGIYDAFGQRSYSGSYYGV